MTKSVYYCVLFILCFSFSNITAQPLHYENQIVEKIDVNFVNLPEGTSFEPASVNARIKTRQGSLFSQLDFDNDLKKLAEEFDHVEPSLISIEGKLYITLKIWPKPTIRSIAWEGNHKLKSNKLQSELGISACSIFDRQAFNCAFHKLKAFYVKKGFFEASLDYNVELDPTTNTVDITICIDEGRAGWIEDIVFVNFTPREEDCLLEKMLTKKYFILTSWYTNEGTYNEEAIQQDRFAILNFLQNEGYADATVDLSVCEASQDNRIVITITAERGDVYSFSTISFEGNHLFCDEEILGQFTFEEGDPFSPDDIRATVRRLSDFYGRHGYIDAVVDYETRLDCECHTYSIHFTIEEGEQYRVGLVKVFGNCSTQTNVILHETLLVPGEIFNIVKLQLTEERLQNIGYFKNVNVYAVRSDAGAACLDGHFRDVHIEVEETITGNFGAGFGLSTVESVFGEFRITERNFNYKGLTSFWKDGYRVLRGGGEYVHLNAMIGAKSRKYTLSWTKPFFRDTPWVVGFEIERSNNRYISEDYDINATGITLHGSYPFNPFLRFGTHYRLRNTYITLNKHKINHQKAKEISELDKARAKGKKNKVKKELDNLEGLTEKLREESRNLGLISAIGISLNYDSTDHPSNPRCGFKSRIEQEIAGFGGDHSFMGLAYLNSYYLGAGSKGVIRLRGDLRFIVPMFGTKKYQIPIDERLFLGGENAIRGYRLYRLGPQFNEGDPRGGMSMQLLSAEYCRTINKRLSAFVFCDSGHLSFDVWNFGTMWTSVGFGINLKVLESAPPITLGLGFPLNPDRRGDVKRFFFNLGGRF